MDRHRKGYWAERWQKQKEQKSALNSSSNLNSSSDEKKSSSKKKKDRRAYYREYNKKHSERLNRGFTKGYINGNVSDGLKPKKRVWLNKTLGIYIIGYDEMGRPITNHPFSDLLRNKELEWHDDDWFEDCD